MNSEQWRRVKELFNAALAQPQDRRRRFLAQAQADSPVRSEVERLLASHEKSETFIEDSPVAGALAAPLRGPLTGQTIDHYDVGPMLGSGGMGTVYAARDLALDRTVAIKVVTSGAESEQLDLHREAQRASKLNHPNVCMIHDVGETGGKTYVVMEHIEGQTLSSLISRGVLPASLVAHYGVQIADALAHAHDRGIVHHDLKCANIMVTTDGRAKVLDFGLARDTPGHRIDEVSQSRGKLMEGEPLAGTLAYIAPERFRGESGGVQSDIWALGIVLFEMANGDRPFRGRTGFELSASILHQPVPGMPSVPALLQTVIRRCLARESRERYATAREVRTELQTVVAEFSAAPTISGAVLNDANRGVHSAGCLPTGRRLLEGPRSALGLPAKLSRIAL